MADLVEGRRVLFAGTVKQSTNQQNWLASDKWEQGRQAGRVVAYCLLSPSVLPAVETCPLAEIQFFFWAVVSPRHCPRLHRHCQCDASLTAMVHIWQTRPFWPSFQSHSPNVKGLHSVAYRLLTWHCSCFTWRNDSARQMTFYCLCHSAHKSVKALETRLTCFSKVLIYKKSVEFAADDYLGTTDTRCNSWYRQGRSDLGSYNDSLVTVTLWQALAPTQLVLVAGLILAKQKLTLRGPINNDSVKMPYPHTTKMIFSFLRHYIFSSRNKTTIIQVH